MNTTVTPWSGGISAAAVLVVGLAIAVALPAAAPALTAGVLLAAGLFITASDDIRREGVGVGAATVGVFGVVFGAMWAHTQALTSLAGLAAVLGSAAVAVGIGLRRGEGDADRLSSTGVTTGVTTIVLFVVGGATVNITDTSVIADLATIVLGLHEPRASVWLFGALVLLFGTSVLLAIRVLPAVTILGPNADDEHAEVLADIRAQFGILVSVLVVATAVFVLFARTGLFQSGIPELVLVVLTSNSLVRLLLVFGTLVALTLTVAGAIMRFAWEIDPERVEAWGATLGGGLVAAVVVVATAPAVVPVVAPIDPGSVGTSLMTTAVIGFISTVVVVAASVCYRFVSGRPLVPFVGLGLLAVVATTVATDTVVAPLVAVAAILVAWDAGSHGRSLATELGSEAPTTQGELAHGSASIGIAAVGVVVATAVAYGRPLLEPLLVSGDATTSIVVGGVLIVVGAILVAVD